jgi:uracil DNA glycosylase
LDISLGELALDEKGFTMDEKVVSIESVHPSPWISDWG